MSELKRCPFCGGEAEILEHDNGWAIWHCIMCKNCKASQEWRKGYTKEEAITAWNTRKPMERIIERLEEMRKVNDLPTIRCYCNTTMNKAIEIAKEEGGIK